MFFPERIVSINPNDKVLEVGPGGAPFARSNVLLELRYESESEWVRQSGNTQPDKEDTRTVFYDGGRFPFADKQFDYVICSHVLEHVPDPVFFLEELFRVAKKGYLEFPSVYYEYIYCIPEHVNYVGYKDKSVIFMPKSKAPYDYFKPVNQLLFDSLGNGVVEMVEKMKNYYIIGFEWHNKVPYYEVNKIEEFCVPWNGPFVSENNTNSETLNGFTLSLKKIIKKLKAILR